MEYTKGEWKAHKISSSGYTIENDIPESDVIARVEYSQDNAQLIAASPNMYEALKLYQSHQEGTHGHYCWKCAEAINKALLKAEGK